jgi:hypothetical protein
MTLSLMSPSMLALVAKLPSHPSGHARDQHRTSHRGHRDIRTMTEPRSLVSPAHVIDRRIVTVRCSRCTLSTRPCTVSVSPG